MKKKGTWDDLSLPHRIGEFKVKVKTPLDIRITWEGGFLEGEKSRLNRVANWQENPDYISGQRASITKQTIDDFAGVEIKGHFYRSSDFSRDILPPRMLIYLGRGHVKQRASITSQGQFFYIPTKDSPRGPIIRDLAFQELEQMRVMHAAGLPIVRPYGIGHIQGMEFCVADSLSQFPDLRNEYLAAQGSYNNPRYVDERHKVYCLVIGTPQADWKRAIDSIPEIVEGYDSARKKRFLKDFFNTFGRIIALSLDQSFILGNPSIDNLSIVDGKGSNQNSLRDFDYQIFLHDPGASTESRFKKSDFKPPEWYGYVLYDIASITNALLSFYIMEEQPMFSPDECKSSLRSWVYRSYKLMKVVQEANYNPTKDFFQGLLGDEFKNLDPAIFDNKEKIHFTDQFWECVIKHPNEMHIDLLARKNPLAKVIYDRFSY